MAHSSVVIEGDRLRIVATGSTEDDYVRVLAGTANDLLGLFEDQTEVATLVSATALSSAVMQNSSASVGAVMGSVIPASGFGSQGILHREERCGSELCSL